MNSSLPKYLQIAENIEIQIEAGQWESGKMPSVRGIASEHRVSVVTASRALQVLRDKGLIRAVERSGCFLVNRDPVATERWALVQRVTPGPWHDATEGITRIGFETVARKQHIHLAHDLLAIQEGHTERDWQRQIRTAREAGVSGVFFLPSRLSDALRDQDQAFLDVCDKMGFPAVLIERDLRGRREPPARDLVCSDDVDGGRQLTRHLLGLGRRRVAFIAGSPTSSHFDRLAGYYHALCEHAAESNAPPEPLVLWQRGDLSSRQAYGDLADELIQRKVDAVLCYQDYTALGVTLEMLARRVRVPEDIAVAGFDDLPIGTMFAVGLTTYAFPSEGVAWQAVRLMRERLKNPDAPPTRVVVPGELRVRDSTTEAGKDGRRGK